MASSSCWIADSRRRIELALAWGKNRGQKNGREERGEKERSSWRYGDLRCQEVQLPSTGPAQEGRADVSVWPAGDPVGGPCFAAPTSSYLGCRCILRDEPNDLSGRLGLRFCSVVASGDIRPLFLMFAPGTPGAIDAGHARHATRDRLYKHGFKTALWTRTRRLASW